MKKRIIAVIAAVAMIYGSALIPQAHEGEPVKGAKDDRKASIDSKDDTDGSRVEADKGGARTDKRENRLPCIRPVEVSGSVEGVEVDEYKGALSTVSTDIWAGSREGSPEEDGTEPSGTDSASADGAEPEPEGYSEDAAADSWEAEVVPEEPVAEEPAPEEPQSEWTYYGNCRITHYCDCPECTGPWYGSATASGAWPSAFYTVASGDDLPFGTEIMINDQVYVVQDRGVGNGQIDIFVGDHQLALDMGMYFADVYVRW